MTNKRTIHGIEAMILMLVFLAAFETIKKGFRKLYFSIRPPRPTMAKGRPFFD